MNSLTNILENFNNNNTNNPNGFQYSVSFQTELGVLIIREEKSNSVSELTLVSTSFYLDLVPDFEGIYNCAFMYNRLLVNGAFRGNGIGADLVNLTLDCIDELNCPIINHVNAYGDMSQEDLINFYKQHGFVDFPIPMEEGLLYYPNSRQ